MTDEEDSKRLRTDKAEAKLEAAIKEYLASIDPADGLLVDWLLLTAEHVDEGGDGTVTANGIWGPSHQRLYNAAGLLRYATIKVDSKIRM